MVALGRVTLSFHDFEKKKYALYTVLFIRFEKEKYFTLVRLIL
jgi:hypothetical protein